jgi:hypothetical protein
MEVKARSNGKYDNTSAQKKYPKERSHEIL